MSHRMSQNTIQTEIFENLAVWFFNSNISRHRLTVPHCRLHTYDRRAFPVAGPTVWNSLQPDELRDPACDVDSFKQFFQGSQQSGKS